LPFLRLGTFFIINSITCLSITYIRIRNIYPVLSALDSKLPRLLVIAIVVLHAAIALTFKIVFFS
jgi:hypothetical protein